MKLAIEFFGIPRQRTGVARAEIECAGCAPRLGEVLQALGEKYPQLAATCLAGDRLRPEITANLSGQRFISDPETCIPPGETLLLLSADAGG